MDIELQDFSAPQSSIDLESQSSPPRRGVIWSSWVGRVVRDVRREADTSDSVSVNSRTLSYLANVSLRSFSMLGGRLSSSRTSLATTLLGSTQITDPQRELLHTITGRSLDDQYHTLTLACTWYTAYLDSKIREAWKPLFRQVLRPAGGPDLSDNPSENDMGKAFKLLEEILNVLQSEDRRGALALSDIVDELYNKELILDEKGSDEQNDDNEQERCKTFQLVFVSLGIISLFFSPVLHPEPKYLQIEGHGEGDLTTVREPGGGFTRYRSKTFISYSESLENGKDQPLYLLLRRFGKIIPRYTRRSWSGFSTPQEIFPGRSDGCIDQSLVCFHTLHKVAAVKIEWVDSLCLHLEFNRPKKLLKVFRFPSLCLIMLSTKDKHILASLFRESSCLNGANEHDVRAYFKEVLLSYRLIFGQTDASYKIFKQLYEQNPEPNESWKAIRLVERLADPLLPILCGQDWESEEASQIYNGIEAEDPTSSYNVSIDFPHLEDRLVKIQNYVRDHNPHTLIAIWNDRRNVPSWWTFWAVIILGGGALFFSFIQALLQGVSIGIQIWGG